MKLLLFLYAVVTAKGKKIIKIMKEKSVAKILFLLSAFSDQGLSNEIYSTGTSNRIEGRFFFKPSFNPMEDVKFLLFTKRNPFNGQRIVLGDVRSLFESNFNFSNPTR